MNRLITALICAVSFSQVVLGQVAVWGQCAGIGYTGSTTCATGNSCVYVNDYYSQCQPGTASSAPTTTKASPTTTTAADSSPSTTSTSGTTTISSYPASQLVQITNFGTNPNNVGMYLYRPKTVASNPPLVVAIHECTASAQVYYGQTIFGKLAETYGYVVLFPSSPHSGTCWDVSSTATLTHNGGSDSQGIVSAVKYAIANWDVNPSRVFAVGSSSGAMMTSVLAGAYPDVFAAGIVDSGVAYGCFGLPNSPQDSWNSQCAQGTRIQTGAQWLAQVKAGYPGYTGQYPRMQVWHGTVDNILYPQNFFEEIKEWTAVFGYPSTPISNVSESYLPKGYSNATYGPRFQAILAQGVGHTVPTYEQLYLEFFGIA